LFPIVSNMYIYIILYYIISYHIILYYIIYIILYTQRFSTIWPYFIISAHRPGNIPPTQQATTWTAPSSVTSGAPEK
jgi:hypothetical protein